MIIHRRVLIINARSTADMIRAGRCVEQYEKTQDRKPGRHNLSVFATRDDYSDPVAVWHNATQVTVHFGDRKE